MNWGREQGQARLPHRHQRVAFDFGDRLHPTAGGEQRSEWFRQQDPTMGPHPDLVTSFDPNRKVFSQPEHWNKMFSRRLPGEGDIKLDVLDSPSLMGQLLTQTDTQNEAYFGVETRGPLHGKVPGINAPFLGEFDRKMMQAMSRPLNKERTLTANDGRFSNAIFLNDPQRHQTLTAALAKQLNTCLDRATNGVHAKLTVLEAAQSGRTDYFCGGVTAARAGPGHAHGQRLPAARGRPPALGRAHGPDGGRAAAGRRRAIRGPGGHTLREHAALIWRAYTAPRRS
ncbi:hypothetical protein STCU_09591 [Strigomonas culicis]|uniref:Uncharacterized protein n=1 Tax=Strigomonas culicis TaxID=28005 RepID=S9TLS8_9TRYP|nr:hypothetical protein STCU_09591 [Strigomonas culicis]|eukprot:EPY19162.1 hypothetical protein STCU_09591 [Strigomonas culicis]